MAQHSAAEPPVDEVVRSSTVLVIHGPRRVLVQLLTEADAVDACITVASGGVRLRSLATPLADAVLRGRTARIPIEPIEPGVYDVLVEFRDASGATVAAVSARTVVR
jgi:hypothetical protein